MADVQSDLRHHQQPLGHHAQRRRVVRGSAAALAAGLTALELGSDIAGSIRVPSNRCGTYSHKPSWGVVPQRGHLPPEPGALAESDLNVVGPMARDVDDLEIALDILTEADGRRAPAPRFELPTARANALSDLRLPVWLDDPAYLVEDDVRSVLEAAVSAVRQAGAQMVDKRPPVTLRDLVSLHIELVYPLMDPSSKPLHRTWLSASAVNGCGPAWRSISARWTLC